MNKNLKIIDLALYLTNHKTLIIADTHLGFEESLNNQGVLIPRTQFNDTVKRLEKIFAKVQPTKIIINGDIKHEFGKISEQEWRYTLKLIDFLSKHCQKLILIKGNHDRVLGPIAKKRNIEVVDKLIIDDILITHGHKIPEILKNKEIKTQKNALHFLCPKNSQSKFLRTIIIAHQHPAVKLKDNQRKEIYKCFLKGKYKRKQLIVMPSFNLVTEGTDIKDKLISPFLKNIENFECFIIGDKIYNFGQVKNLP